MDSRYQKCLTFNINRMRITKKIILSVVSILIFCSCSSGTEQTKAVKNGWNLSMQSYTFHLFTVPEALDKTAELGLKFIEIYPGQRMGTEFEDAVFGYNLTPDQQDQLKELAASKNIKIISSGVWTASRDEWAQVFPFAKN